MTEYPFPKIDLHLHLDGSFRTKTMFELAQERGIELPGGTLESYEEYMIEHANAESVNDYLQMFDWPSAVLQDRDSLIRITKELIEDLAEKGVRYAEIRFAPQLHTRKGMSQADAIEAVLEGRRQGLEENPGIDINIINCMMSFGPETLNWDANMETVEVTKDYFSDDGVVALDLAGFEDSVPMSEYAELFVSPRKKGMNLTIHAGDNGIPQNCATVIEYGAKRIGHGHHCYYDAEIARLVVNTKTALEICLTSNIQCKTEPSYVKHPAKNLLDMGAVVTLNTDNMILSDITIEDEYDHALNECGFTWNDLITCNINSFRSSFMKEEDKAPYIEKLKTFYR